MNFESLYRQFYSEYYDSVEIQDDDIMHFREIIGSERKDILEVCCGSGRILIPLAKEHNMTGIDIDNMMISRLFMKADDMQDITIILDNVLTHDYKNDYDYVLLAGNIMINIDTTKDVEDYKLAQRQLIAKAFETVRVGGKVIVDCDGFYNKSFFKMREVPREEVITNSDNGITLKNIVHFDYFDSDTQIWESKRTHILTTKDGITFEKDVHLFKYIISVDEIMEIIKEVGFNVDTVYIDRELKEPTENIHRLTVVASK